MQRKEDDDTGGVKISRCKSKAMQPSAKLFIVDDKVNATKSLLTTIA